MKCGFDSRDEEVVQFSLKAVESLGQEVLNLGMNEQLWAWLSGDDIIDILLYLYEMSISNEILPIF